jgi:hypothetical protein
MQILILAKKFENNPIKLLTIYVNTMIETWKNSLTHYFHFVEWHTKSMLNNDITQHQNVSFMIKTFYNYVLVLII